MSCVLLDDNHLEDYVLASCFIEKLLSRLGSSRHNLQGLAAPEKVRVHRLQGSHYVG